MTARGVITAIQAQKAHPDRVSLFIDNEFSISLRRELVFHLHLQVGQTVTEEDREKWRFEENCFAAKETAIKYITQHAKTTQQIYEYLLRKEFEPHVAAQTINYLEKMGYINDAEFASFFVTNRVQSRPRGKRMVRWELQQKGIHGQMLDQALNLYGDETEAALRLLAKKFSADRIKNLEDLRTEEIKFGRYLARKGFATHTIQTVLGQLRVIWEKQKSP